MDNFSGGGSDDGSDRVVAHVGSIKEGKNTYPTSHTPMIDIIGNTIFICLSVFMIVRLAYRCVVFAFS